MPPTYAIRRFRRRRMQCRRSSRSRILSRCSQQHRTAKTEQAHLGDWDAAYRNLQAANAGRAWFDPSEDAAFEPVLKCPLVQRVIAQVNAGNPAAPARLYRTIPSPDLIPEGIAADPATGDFYLSSIFHRKIVRFRGKGPVGDFISSGQDGTLGGLGIRIDPGGNLMKASDNYLVQVLDTLKQVNLQRTVIGSDDQRGVAWPSTTASMAVSQANGRCMTF
jgi:hypothetical protein